MLKIFIFQCFILSFTLFAESSKKTITNNEVYIYGTIFLLTSIGSLLVIVNLFPKGEAYKKQQQRLDMAIKAQEGKITNSNINSLESNSSTMRTEILDKNVTATALNVAVTNPSQPAISAVNVNPAHTSMNVPVTKPSASSIPSTHAEVKIINYNKVFDSKSLVVENTCKDFLNKVSNMAKVKSISIYFVHSEKFNCYMEKKLEIFTKYDAGKKIDLNDEVIRFLKNKLGAFSSNHIDAVLPLINNNQLFGGVKIEFAVANPSLDINPIWSEIKSFAKYFEQSIHYNLSVQDTETSLFTLEHFNNILNYRITLEIPQNLSLVKVNVQTDKAKAQKEVVESIKEIIGKNPEAYKLSEDIIGLFLSVEEREKVVKSLPAIIIRARKHILNLEFNIGSADYNSAIKFANKWYERATTALQQSIASGKNQFKLFEEVKKV